MLDKKKKRNDLKLAIEELQKNLILPGMRGASNAMPTEEMRKEVTAALQNGNKMQSKDGQYSLTPKGILFALISAFYDKDCKMSLNQFEKFQEALVERLSLQASGNTSKDLLGKDFNEFFSIHITTTNLLDKAIRKLNDNGIECNLQDLLEEDDDEQR